MSISQMLGSFYRVQWQTAGMDSPTKNLSKAIPVFNSVFPYYAFLL